MNKYLLDTNILIWVLADSSNISPTIKDIILADNDIFVTDVSLWEIAIKNSIGKLKSDRNIYEIIEKRKILDFSELEITARHFEVLRTLPFIHKDPFDRLIISQAICEDMIILSADTVFSNYSIRVIE